MILETDLLAAEPMVEAVAEPPTQLGASQPDADAIARKKQEIQGLWDTNVDIQTKNKKNRYELGKSIDELNRLRAHHGNGTFDADIRELGIPKATAWRIRNYYRENAGLTPIPMSVSSETNRPEQTGASDQPAVPGGEAKHEALGSDAGEPKSAADRLRDRARQKKKVTQIRLEPARHEIFVKALKKWAETLGTGSDSETIFQLVTTFEVQPCAK